MVSVSLHGFCIQCRCLLYIGCMAGAWFGSVCSMVGVWLVYVFVCLWCDELVIVQHVVCVCVCMLFCLFVLCLAVCLACLW